jgi:protein-tyrosine-phosphatase
MKKILFVCTGNVGRSQMAEAYYNKYSGSDAAVSAGVDPLTPNKYPKLAQEVIDVMREEGIDVSEKAVKNVNQEMINDVERVIVICEKELCPQFLKDSKKVTYWKINDPYNTSIDNFRIIRDQIKVKVLELINKAEIITK